MTLNPIELLPFSAVFALLAVLAVIALLIGDDGQTPTWPNPPRRAKHRPAPALLPWGTPTAEVSVLAEADPEPTDLIESGEEVIEYHPLDHRIPLEEVERRMAAATIEAARVDPELVAA